jgi:nitrous oxidase accessory protein
MRSPAEAPRSATARKAWAWLLVALCAASWATAAPEDMAAPDIAAAPAIAIAPGDPLPPLTAGAELRLLPGVHAGPWAIDAADVRLVAAPGAVLDGGGAGTALTVTAPGVRIEGLTVTGVGPHADLYAPDAAVALLGAHGAVVQGLRAHGVTAGVHVEDAADVRLLDLDLRGDARGPGVTSYLTPGLRIEGGRIEGFLDGAYLERADGALVADLELHGNRRYGLHVMFTAGVTLRRNVVAGGGVGSAVMYGRDAVVTDNLLEGHRGPMAFGLLLQEERDAVLSGNTARGNTVGLLLVAASGARLDDNRLEGNGVGVLLDRAPAGSVADASSVTIVGHDFVANAADLAVADDDAALALRGNAFDRAPPLDVDGDGVIDLPYVATSAFAARAARQPDLMLLAYGPGIALWQRLESGVPGLRAAAFADPAPRLPEPVRRDAGAGWPAALAALALAFGAAANARGWS